MFRTEKDSLGEKMIPNDALYGIHAARAKENFPIEIPFPVEWYRAVGITKLACYETYRNFRDAASARLGKKLPFRIISDEILNALISSASEIAEGRHSEYFIVPAVQGGAGTSINMNINEIITNAALIKLGHKPGEYSFIDPTEHANIYQSTNDVIPTSLTVAVLKLVQELEAKINTLRQKIEELENRHREDLRPGYTQMQEAVPSSFGVLFSTYSDALSRDWWRVSKISERIKQVNLGGGAIGTGIAQPRYFIMEVVPSLRKLTGLTLAHGENLPDSTANLDRWVELHAILKSHAVNLEKMTSDIRLLASDLVMSKTISIPAVQVGSSIMPGKVNPVIPEFVISSTHKLYANDQLVSSLAAAGNLELNAYIPVIGCAVIESIKLLIACCSALVDKLFSGIIVNKSNAYNTLIRSGAITTALVPHIGYHKAAEIAALMKERSISIFEANKILKLMTEEKINSILTPGNLLRLGFSIDDL
ncbi:MAG TPA: lyase family protein [Bacteroidales bacterium]|nr:lyase family protein [Bacteroidales bacterium]